MHTSNTVPDPLKCIFPNWCCYFCGMDSRSKTSGLEDMLIQSILIDVSRLRYKNKAVKIYISTSKRWNEPFPRSSLTFLESSPSASQVLNTLCCQEGGAPKGVGEAVGSSQMFKPLKDPGWLMKAGVPPTGLPVVGTASLNWDHAGGIVYGPPPFSWDPQAQITLQESQLLLFCINLREQERSFLSNSSGQICFHNYWIPRILWFLGWFFCFFNLFQTILTSKSGLVLVAISCWGWWDFLVKPRTQGLLLIFKTILVTPSFYALGLPIRNVFCLFRKLHDCYFTGEKTTNKQIKFYLNMTNQNKLWKIL